MSDVITTIESDFESRGFLWLVLIGSAGGVALTVANAIEYNRAKTNCVAISTNTANVLLWLNVILAIILAIIFIWAIYRLLVHPRTMSEITRRPSVTTVTTRAVSPKQMTTIPTSQILTPTSGSASANLVTPETARALQAQVLASQ
jgi:hypothetical protein